MRTDQAIRLVISASEARSWLDHLIRQGKELPEWVQNWNGNSSVWLDSEVAQ